MGDMNVFAHVRVHHMQRVFLSVRRLVDLGVKMNLKKIVIYGIALLILYHFSRYLTLLILTIIAAKYVFKGIRSGKDKASKILNRLGILRRNFSIKKRIKDIVNYRGELRGLVRINRPSTLYQCEKENFYVIVNGFKAILFSIIKVEIKAEKSLMVKTIEKIYELLSPLGNNFHLILRNTNSKLILYIVIYTASYTLRLTPDLLTRMINEVDGLRRAVALSLSSLGETILNFDVVQNRELIEVMI